MVSSDTTQREKRRDYIEQWYKTEKSLTRIGGVLLIFASAMIAVFDQPGDQWTALALAGCIAGGITLLMVVRQSRNRRTTLNFLKEGQQQSRAIFAGMGAMLLITQLGMRPLTFIISGILLIIASWYQWRAYKIKHFDMLFIKDVVGDNDQ